MYSAHKVISAAAIVLYACNYKCRRFYGIHSAHASVNLPAIFCVVTAHIYVIINAAVLMVHAIVILHALHILSAISYTAKKDPLNYSSEGCAFTIVIAR